jgi:hypothetical protein
MPSKLHVKSCREWYWLYRVWPEMNELIFISKIRANNTDIDNLVKGLEHSGNDRYLYLRNEVCISK